MELNQPRCTPFFLSYRLLVKHNHRTGRVLQLLRVKSHWCQKQWSNKLEHIPCKNGSILHYPKPWWYNMRCDIPYWNHGDGCWQEETLPRSEQAAKVGHQWIIKTNSNKTQNVEGLRPTNTDICFCQPKKKLDAATSATITQDPQSSCKGRSIQHPHSQGTSGREGSIAVQR